MFNPAETVLDINDKVQLRFYEDIAPYYSRLSLYHDGKRVSDCGFKAEEKSLIQEGMKDYNALMNTLRSIHTASKSDNLNDFITLVERYKDHPEPVSDTNLYIH